MSTRFWFSAVLLTLAAPLASAAVFTVNSNGGGTDGLVGDGICQVGTSGNECTLRAAVAEANAVAATLDTIQFAVIGSVPGGMGLNASANLVGPQGRITISGGNATRAFFFSSPNDGATAIYNVSNVIFTQGMTTNPSGGGSNDGGSGLLVCGRATTTVNAVNVDVTSSVTRDEFGGGVAVCDGNTLNWAGGLVANNVGDSFGGGIYSIGTLNLSSVTVQGNRVQGSVNATTTQAAGGGGGIYAIALAMTGGALIDNVIEMSGGVGGGLAFQGENDQSTARLTGVTLRGNRNANGDGGGMAVMRGQVMLGSTLLQANMASRNGGGVYLGKLATAAVGGGLRASQSIFSGNQATAGGAIYTDAALGKSSSLVHASLVDNRANAGAALGAAETVGPSAFPGDATAPFTSNLFSGNLLASGAPGSCNRSYAHSAAGSSGYNLSDDASCGFVQASDQQNTMAMLAPLADKGGDVPSPALLSGSPAIDKGNPDFEPSGSDARGAPVTDGDELQDARRDIGAYEFAGFGAVQLSVAETSASEAAGRVEVQLRRFGNTEPVMQVTAATADAGSGSGFAAAGSDYTATGQPVNWASNERATKLFAITLVSDAVVEPVERFAVRLSGLARAADFGAISGGMVAIADAGAVAGGGGSGAGTGSSNPPVNDSSTSGGGSWSLLSLLSVSLIGCLRRRKLTLP